MSTSGNILGAHNASTQTSALGLEDVDLYGASPLAVENSTTSGESLLNKTAFNTQVNAQSSAHAVSTFVNENANDPVVSSASPTTNPRSRRNSDTGKQTLSSNSRKDSTLRRDSDPPPSPETKHTMAPQPHHFLERPPSAWSPFNSSHIRKESRHRSSSRRSSYGIPTPPASVYGGLGFHPSPQMFAPPLPISQYGASTPPGDYSWYLSNAQSNSVLPSANVFMPTPVRPFYGDYTPYGPPSIPGQPPPITQQSANIVAAVAKTPEIKNLRSIRDPAAILGAGAGSFADNNPYRRRSLSKQETDFHVPYQHNHPARGRSQSQTWGAPAPFTPQNMPSPYLPYSEVHNSTFVPNAQGRDDSHAARLHNHSQFDSPSQPEIYPDDDQQSQSSQQDAYQIYQWTPASPYNTNLQAPWGIMTTSEVVSAALNMPTPKKSRTQSFMENEPRIGSFADYNPYRRAPTPKITLDTVPTPSLPPPHPSSPPRWPSHARRSSSSDSMQGDRDFERYQPSRSYYRSPSPTRSRRRQRQRSYSYGTSVSSMYPYRTPSMPFDSALFPRDSRAYRHHLQGAPGFWSRFAAFFRSPFDRGRPTSFEHLYSRGATEEPVTLYFILTVIIGQVYFHLLLRLPSLYFSRVSRIFDEANLNLHEITEMAFETSEGVDSKDLAQAALNMQVHKIRPQYERLKKSWEGFIDSLIREWETFNIVSVMLLTAILTILQISTAASDPVTRYAALFSLVCALISLLFGCIYIIRFGTMRKPYAAVEWAKSALLSSQSVIWNVWVLLSMPVIWLTWSIVLFIVSVMSFVWRTDPANDSASTFILSSTGLLVVRIALSIVLALGLLNAMLIMHTFRLYGDALDKYWRIWIDEWRKAKAKETPLTYGSAIIPPGGQYVPTQFHMPPYTPLGSYLPPSRPSSTAFPESSYAGHESRRQRSSRRRRGSAWGDRDHSERDTHSDSSETSSLRRSRRRSRSPRPYARTPSRNSPSRSYTHASHNYRTEDINVNSQRVSPAPDVSTSGPQAYMHHSEPSILPLGSDSDQGQYPRNHVRFRSPLESTHGSSDQWDPHDNSFNYPSPGVVAPSSSSASASGGGITHESSNVQTQHPALLRRRRP